VTDPAGPAVPPPGWYREAADSTGYRWWDGRGWTEHRTDTPGGAAGIEQPPLPAGTSTNTLWGWLLSLLPLVAIAAGQPAILAYGPFIRQSLRTQRQLLADPHATVITTPSGSGSFVILFIVSWLLSLALLGLAALAAYLDWRTLKARGIVRPFHWAWGFLAGVYIVGRAVVLGRRVGHGWAPMWVAIALFVVAMGIQFTEYLSILASAGVFSGS
jgi:hypothetical protein